MSVSAAGRWLALVALSVMALVLLACHDEIPSAPPLEPAASASNDADRQADLESIYSSEDPDEWLEAAMQESREECDGYPKLAELRSMLGERSAEELWHSLLMQPTDRDQRIIEVVAEATAEHRGISLEELPTVWLFSRDELASYACLAIHYMSAGEDFRPTIDVAEVPGLPARRLELLLLHDHQLLVYSPVVEYWSGLLLVGAWYGDDPEAGSGPGEIMFITGSPLDTFHIGAVSHEVVHFLQDQLTDWQLHDRYLEGAYSDEVTAWRWLVEGDATLHQLCLEDPPLDTRLADEEWPSDGDEAAALEDNSTCDFMHPERDRYLLYSPYHGGAALLQSLREEHGRQAIDELLLNPPETSEQVLHTDKLLSREAPIALTDLEALQRDVLPSSEWQEPILDRMGEQWLVELFLTAMDDIAQVVSAAAGWGGDQMALWQSHDDETEVVTWQVVFDDAEEHLEGVFGLRRWFFSHTDNEAEAVDEHTLSWDGSTGAARLVSLEEAVWLVASNEAEAADAVASGIRDGEWHRYWSE